MLLWSLGEGWVTRLIYLLLFSHPQLLVLFPAHFAFPEAMSQGPRDKEEEGVVLTFCLPPSPSAQQPTSKHHSQNVLSSSALQRNIPVLLPSQSCTHKGSRCEH